MREVEEPLLDQETAARLSLAIQIVRSAMSRWVARIPLWAMTPASSKSEMETVPRGLADVIREAAMCAGNRKRHRTGAAVGSKASNHTPPMPKRQASQAPMSEGAVGTSS